jgi:hypothetical protein
MSIELREEGAAGVVLRNVAELAQRQQARELGSGLARQIFRLLKVAQFHALDNMAVLQQLDQTAEALAVFGRQTGEPLTLLFAKSTVFVNGQLLKASRSEYESALELSEMVHRLGVTQLTIQHDADRADLTALARLFQPPHKTRAEHGVIEPSPRVRLRYVSAAKLDENEQEMTPEEHILRTYATTVVVMRRVYENLQAGRYQLPYQAKRLAQRLVALSEGDTPAFLGVTAMRNFNHDAAGRAVNRSILAVAMGRQLTHDLATLSRIAMSALFLDVAMPLVTGTVGKDAEVVAARMTDEAERRLPAATAAVLTALGQLREASLVRTVIAYEAQWLRQTATLGPMYEGLYKPMVAARIVAVAHRFNVLMEPDLAASRSPSVDDALAALRAEATDALDTAMYVLLVGALGVFPRGTPVELSTGERGVVVRTPDNPADYPRPSVRLVYDASGQLMKMKVTVALDTDAERQVVRVITRPDPALLEAARAIEAAAPPPPPSLAPSPAPPASEARLPASEPRPPAPEPRPPASEPRPPAPPGDGAHDAPTIRPARRVPDSAKPDVRTTSAAGSAPRRSRSLVEVVDAPTSRRDPRAEDWDEDDAPPSSPLSPPISQRGLPLTRRLAHPEVMPDTQEISQVEPSSPSMHWRSPPRTLQPNEFSAALGAAGTHAPSASGSLERTPFSHVLLYILDRALSGSLILTETTRESEPPLEHAVYFQDGIPCKVHTGVRVAPLGPLLVAYDVIDQMQLEAEPISQPPVHEATLERELIESGLARTDQIAEARNEQLGERLSYLFSLPPATRYAFYNGFDLLEPIWGTIPGVVSPHAVLSRGLREHPETAAIARVLQRVGDHRLAMKPDADLLGFELSEEEAAVAAALAEGTPTVFELMSAGHEAALVYRIVYQLLLAHCIAPVRDPQS